MLAKLLKTAAIPEPREIIQASRQHCRAEEVDGEFLRGTIQDVNRIHKLRTAAFGPGSRGVGAALLYLVLEAVHAVAR
ncbi:MAG: hypothetical protein PVI59_17155, partial [Anaerolineae bacterium]